MSDKPPDLTGKKLDFSLFHATGDHWPFTPYCRTMYGGGRIHLKYAWEFRYRESMLAPWHWLTCRLGRHEVLDGWQRADTNSEWYKWRHCRYCHVDFFD